MSLIKNLIWRLFGKKIIEAFLSDSGENDTTKYADTGKENITALLAGSVANIAMGDAQVTVAAAGGGESKFSSVLQSIAQRVWSGVKQTVSCALGCGEIVSIPYSVDNGLGRKIYIDTVSKDRVYITGKQGDEITQCVVLAQELVRNNKRYRRFTDYSVENGVYIIRNKAVCNDSPAFLSDIDEWSEIPEEIRIGGVDRLPIAFLRCPQNPRRPNAPAGVPITFGCNATLEKIAKTLDDIEREYDKKKAKILADRSLIRLRKNKDGDPDEKRAAREFENNDLYVALGNSDKIGIEIFDPAIRDSAYYNKLEKHFAFLEKECGLSEGVLTKLSTSAATATEVRRSMYNTFCFCDGIHQNVVRWFNDLMYACSVLINFYGMAPYSEYEVNFSWSYSLLEDDAQTFSQRMQAESIGAESAAEIRLINHPEETLEQAQEKVDKIRASRQSVQQIIDEE